LTLNLIIPAIATSITFFIVNLPDYWDRLGQSIGYFDGLELFGWSISVDEISGLLGRVFADFSIESLWAPITVIMGAATSLFRGVIAVIASIYVMMEKEKCRAYINKLLRIFTSVRFRSTTIWVFTRLNKNIRQYVWTQTLGGIILGAMSMVALIFMGSPYVLLIGIMLWFANYIPYFGSIFATIAAILIVAFTQGLTMGIIAAGVLFLIQQVEVNIIQPKLMSDAFEMSPLLVFISISVGGAIANIWGMVVVIPIVAVLKDIFDNIVAYYEREKFGTSIEAEEEDEWQIN